MLNCRGLKYSSSYAKSLNHPNFPIPIKRRIKPMEENIHKWNDIYLNQKKLDSLSAYVLHDGPPYANGLPHVGHALNKILKDITIRYKLLQGHKVELRPGWDCHGLPIELKALEAHKRVAKSPLEIRQLASQVADHFLHVQRASFKGWGVLGDWEAPYRTNDWSYEARQLLCFGDLWDKGLIYRGLLPVYWSYSSGTALADAELEYNEEHKSLATYVKLTVAQANAQLQSAMSRGHHACSVLVWTTTPWTLVANEAVAVHATIMYTLLWDSVLREYLIVGSNFVDQLSQLLSSSSRFHRLSQFPGCSLLSTRYVHPIYPHKICPLLHGDHVTTEKGTGLVHVAPSHGREDFDLGRQHSLPVTQLVDEMARFTPAAGHDLAGRFVLTDGTDKVLSLLGSHLVHREMYVHSYPYDWRSKQPVILRPSNQWFINTTKLTDQVMAAYSTVSVYPESHKAGMLNMIRDRPDWCISRQRVWGVPIPVFYGGQDGTTPIVNRQLIDHLANRVMREGSDFWWRESVDEIIPRELWRNVNVPAGDLRKGSDIFDIWVDSGLSWLTLRQNGADRQADLYLEGHDQIRGWFSASLYLSVALTGNAPYKRLVIHGFTTDSEGRKMSKSLGNTVDPETIIATHGVDVLRFWAASAGLGSISAVGASILERHAARYKALRNMFRFMLGNLADADVASSCGTRDPSVSQLLPQDRYVVHLVATFLQNSAADYDRFRYDLVLAQLDHLTARLSNFYFTVAKDRLYCEPKESAARRSAQACIGLALHHLVIAIAPILPELAEEVWQAKCESSTALGTGRWPPAESLASWLDPDVAHRVEFVALPLQQALLDSVGSAERSGNPLARTQIEVSPGDDQVYNDLLDLHPSGSQWGQYSPLCEILRCAQVRLLQPHSIPSGHATKTVTVTLPSSACCNLYYSLVDKDCLCPRCRRYVREGKREDHVVCARCAPLVLGNKNC